MSQERTITFPAGAVRMVADRLMDFDWNVPDGEALEIAENVVIDVTRAVDELRTEEGVDLAVLYGNAIVRISELVAEHDGEPVLGNRIRAVIARLDTEEKAL